MVATAVAASAGAESVRLPLGPYRSKRTAARTLLLVGVALLCVALSGSAVYFAHGIYEPRATLSEFVRDANGLTATVASLVSAIFVPLLTFLFKRSLSVRWLRRTLLRVVPTVLRSSGWAAVALALMSSALLATGWRLHQRVTPFESQFNRIMDTLYEEEYGLAERELATLLARNAYELSLLDLGKFAAQVQRYWVTHSASSADWARLSDSLTAWQQAHATLREFDVLALKGRILLATQQQESALHTFDLATKNSARAPEQVVAALYLGEALMKSERFSDALPVFQRAALQADYDNERKALVLRKLGVCKAMLRDWAGAEGDFSQALTLTRTSTAVLYSDLGFVRTAHGNFSAAIEALQRAIELSPDDPVPRINLGITYAEQGLYNLADEALAQAWNSTDRHTVRPTRSSDAVLVRLTQAWVQLRHNSSYRTGVVEYVRRAQGITPVPAKIADLVSEPNTVARIYIDGARLVLSNQNLYGLEFMAFDFLREAGNVADDHEIKAAAGSLIASLPYGATQPWGTQQQPH